MNNKINAYKLFLQNGDWTAEMLKTLKDLNHITEDEYREILQSVKKTKATDENIVDISAPYTYEIWDKKSSINGETAENMLKDPVLKNASSIFLVKNPHNGNIDYVESVDVIKGSRMLRATSSPADVAQYYTDKLTDSKILSTINLDSLTQSQQIYLDIINTNKTDVIIDLLTQININLQTLLSYRG